MPKYLDEAGVRKLWTKTKQKASEAQNNAVATAGNYSVNGKKINTNPTLSKSDVGLGNVTNDAQIPLSQKGAVNGVATLGTDGKVPTSQLPSYVDDVVEFNGKSTFPAKGETGKIYVDTSDNKTYRWSGTAYVEISASLALGETSSTAYAGDKGKTLATKVSALGNTVGDIPDIMLIGIDTIAESAADGTAVTINYQGYDRANKVELSASTEIPAATSTAAGVMSKADKAKLDGIAAGANAYSHPAGSAASKAAGLYKISTDAQSHVASATAVTKTDITALGIPAQDTTYSAATTSANGLMSKEDKSKLNGIAAGANAYSHPSGSAPSKALGLYKISTDAQSHVASVAEVTKDDITKLGIPAKDTTYAVATSSADGLMSASDKEFLDYYIYNRGNYLQVDNSDFTYSTNEVKIGHVSHGSLDDPETFNVVLRAATSAQAGVMSAADKKNLDYYSNSRGNYLEIYSDGRLYYTESAVNLGEVYRGPLDNIDTTNVILNAATTKKAGVMSAADKVKLDGIAALTDAEIDAILADDGPSVMPPAGDFKE